MFAVNYFSPCFQMLVTVLQTAGGCSKKTNTVPPKATFAPPPPIVAKNCHAVVFLFPIKNNRHDTFLACRNCGRDRTGVYLDDTAVTVVNCCQRVATRLIFMFTFGREHYSEETYNTFAIVTTIWKPGLR